MSGATTGGAPWLLDFGAISRDRGGMTGLGSRAGSPLPRRYVAGILRKPGHLEPRRRDCARADAGYRTRAVAAGSRAPSSRRPASRANHGCRDGGRVRGREPRKLERSPRSRHSPARAPQGTTASCLLSCVHEHRFTRPSAGRRPIRTCLVAYTNARPLCRREGSSGNAGTSSKRRRGREVAVRIRTCLRGHRTTRAQSGGVRGTACTQACTMTRPPVGLQTRTPGCRQGCGQARPPTGTPDPRPTSSQAYKPGPNDGGAGGNDHDPKVPHEHIPACVHAAGRVVIRWSAERVFPGETPTKHVCERARMRT